MSNDQVQRMMAQEDARRRAIGDDSAERKAVADAANAAMSKMKPDSPMTGSTNRLIVQTEGWTAAQYCAKWAELERELAALRAKLAEAEALAERNAKDAEKWQAFVGCARIRVVGSAGIHEPVPGDERWIYAHMGLELWTMSQAGSEPDAVGQIELFLDKVRAARGKP